MRSEISILEKMTIQALIVIEVHSKYVLQDLIANQVLDLEDFNWISQLRYYTKQS